MATFRVWLFNLKIASLCLSHIFKWPHFPVKVCFLPFCLFLKKTLWLFSSGFSIWVSCTTNLFWKMENAQERGLRQPCPHLCCGLSVVPTPGTQPETLSNLLRLYARVSFLGMVLENGKCYLLLCHS